MSNQQDQYWQAVQERNPAFDGVFYYGVVTTGVYCRPSCNARTPLRKNVRFYQSRDAAEGDGLRPCKRCRPDAELDTRANLMHAMSQYIEKHHLPFTQSCRGFRPPGCWEPFELCVRTIIGQQISVAAAQTIMRRLLERCGDLSPQALLSANLDNMGMPGRRVQTLSRLAHAVIAGEIDFSWPWQRLDSGGPVAHTGRRCVAR